ncbi:MAG: hypothetical protein HY337_10100 [Gemmatimonadetes bacterium]|nr:hypothetical protein [Gemmatimonadota bacterium]
MDGRARTERDDLPCLWVLAGVLSYRLCDKGYDCENCDLYRALGGGTRHDRLPVAAAASAGSVQDQVNAYVCRLVSESALRLDRAYSLGHFWIDDRDPKHPILGLDGHAWRVLFPVDDVVLPKPGAWLKRGGPCGWIERRHAVIPLTAPVAGEVQAVNEAYRAALRARETSGSGDEWLLHLESHEALDHLPDLLRGEQVLHWYLGQIQLLKHYLAEATAPVAGAQLGPTLHDGGAPAPDLEAVLGRERYQNLVDEIFYTQT